MMNSDDCKYPTREAWLEAAVREMRPWFEALTHKGKAVVLPETRISLGWPKRGKAWGECWHAEASEDGSRQIFISPDRVCPIGEDGMGILETVAHELCHAALPDKMGHRKPWKDLCEQLGIEVLSGRGHTRAGDAMKARLNVLSDKLGPFPHSKLVPTHKVVQRTRMLKVQCPRCGYVARTTEKWLTEAGAPVCPTDNIPMVEDE